MAAALLLGLAAAPTAVAGAGTKVLRIATSGDYAPFSYSAATEDPSVSFQTSLAGFDIDVATRFAKDRGEKIEFVRFRWPDLAEQLETAKFDIAMSGITLKASRSVGGRFSVAVAATHAVALTWEGSGATTVNDLNRPSRRIAVNAGGYLEQVARNVFTRADIVALADNAAVRMAMLDRAFDAVVTDNFEERVWTASAKGVVRIAPLTDDRKAYLLPSDRGDLAGDLDRWLMQREKDGTLAKLRAQYFGEGTKPEDSAPLATAQPLAALGDAIVERLSLMPWVYAAKKQDNLSIEDKDREGDVLASAEAAVEKAAGQAGVKTPDPKATREVFSALMATARDAQQSIADREAKFRRSSVSRREGKKDAAGDESDAADSTDTGDQTEGAANSNAPAEEFVKAAPREQIPDLATKLRPAIGRITEKIARILVAIDEDVSRADIRRALWNALTPHRVSAARIDELTLGVDRVTTSR